MVPEKDLVPTNDLTGSYCRAWIYFPSTQHYHALRRYKQFDWQQRFFLAIGFDNS